MGDNMKRRWIDKWIGSLRLAVWIAGLPGIPIAFIVWLHPVLGAAVCPRCFGFEYLGNQVFIEKGATQADQAAILKDLAIAERRVQRFFGVPVRHLRVLVCETQVCVRRIGSGSAQIGSIGPYVLVIAPQGRRIVLITHELAQIEVEDRIGIVRQISGAVPAWFEQGVDVLVSDDPDYLSRRSTSGDRCLADRPGELPADMDIWLKRAGDDPVMYAQAACRVDRWMLKRGGPKAVKSLLDRISEGGTFRRIYGAEQ